MKKILQKCVRFFIPVALVFVIFAMVQSVRSNREYVMEAAGKNQLAEEEIAKMLQMTPEPTEENLAKIVQKIRDYDVDYILCTTPDKQFNLDFFKENKPKNEVDFYFSLMSYIQFLENYAKKSAVKIPVKFAFGFDAYIEKDSIPDRNIIDSLYEQSEIVAKILVLLFDANDYGMDLRSISREAIQGATKGKVGKQIDDSGGTIDATKSAFLRKEGLKSYLFSLEFSCYTSGLRNFMNQFQQYCLPILIRSLEINENNSTVNGGILSTEKINVKMVMEWIFIKNSKNIFTSEKVMQE